MPDNQQTSDHADAQAVPLEIAAAPRIDTPTTVEGPLVPAPVQVDAKAKEDFASFHAEYIHGYISLADTKAAWVFAIPAALLAYLGTQQETWQLFVTQNLGWLTVLAIVGAAGLLTSAAASFAVIVPRQGGSPSGIVYFASVATHPSAASYQEALRPLDEPALLAARLAHNFDVARICTRKYKALRVAMWSAAIGLAATLSLVGGLHLREAMRTATPRQPQKESTVPGKPAEPKRPDVPAAPDAERPTK